MRSSRSRLRSWRPLLAGLASGIFMTVAGVACRPGHESVPDVAIDCQIDPDPPTIGASTITVSLADAGARPVVGATVLVEANMSHPGMRPLFARATEIAPARYRADLEFTMAGDWILSVSAALRDGRTAHTRLDVPGIRRH
jgi:hypothetical protein